MNQDNTHHNSANTIPLSRLLHPKYWLTWLFVGVFYLICLLPYQWLLKLGRGLGWVVQKVGRRWRHIAQRNIALCFPEYSNEQQQQLVHAHFANLGMSMVETGYSWWHPQHLTGNYSITGLEHIKTGLAQGRGVLILGPHFTTIDIFSRLFTRDYPLTVVGRHQNNVVVDYLLKRGRNANNLRLIDRKDLRAIYRALANNELVWYAPDQDYGAKHSVFAPFFNIPAATITIPSRLAEKSQAAVLVAGYYRLSDNTGYQAELSPPLQNYPSGDEVKDGQQVNQMIEAAIRKYPEQYLWIHRRFKTRPEGMASLYK